MKNILLRVLPAILILHLGATFSAAQTLSDSAQISILTIGPGAHELYSAFGHSAIRVSDPTYRYDAAYNYGTFDFNRPNFYLNFARGYLVYKLAVQDSRALIAYYKRENRSVQEQVLNLTQKQKQKVFDYLQHNARPENADYYYDYFYDNCATRIGDVFVDALGDDFRFDESFVTDPGHTIRELTDRYSANYYPWGKLGIDLCLGMPMDNQLSNLEYMYLPDYVFKGFAKASVQGEGGWHSVVKETNDLFVADATNIKAPFFSPILVFWLFLIFVVLASFYAYRYEISLRWFDTIYFFLLGLLGVFFLLLWTATDHAAAANNLNILWAWPTHFLVAWFMLKRNRPTWLNWYFLLTFSLGLLLLVFWWAIPQDLNNALIPIVLVAVGRAGIRLLE